MNIRVFTHTIWIARPRETVFDFFVDFAQAARWRSYVRSMEPVDPGPVKTGSRIRVSMDVAGEEYSFELLVLANERPALWRHRSNETDYHGAIEYRFEPEENGTRVSMRCDVKPISMYGWLSVPLLLLSRGKAYKDQLPKLKLVLEEDASAPNSLANAAPPR